MVKLRDKPIEKSTLILFICIIVLATFSIYQFIDLEKTKLMEDAGWNIAYLSSVSEGKHILVTVRNKGTINFLITDFIIDGENYGPTEPIFVPVQRILAQQHGDEYTHTVRFTIPFEWGYKTSEKEEYRIQIITHSGKIIEMFRSLHSIN